MSLNRRTFVTTSAAAAGAMALPAISYGRISGSNNKPNIACIGIRGRGNSHIGAYIQQLTALCDCDKQVLANRAEEVKSKINREVKQYVDYRELVADDSIDVVCIATPNHTHAVISIEAAKNGKDVYVEKPVSHNVWEGRQIVNAARKYDRIIQTGTQSRSSVAITEAVEYVRSGKLGKIRYAVGTCYKPRKSIGKLDKPLQIPDHIDYDLWCGPAEKRDLFRPQLHYDWHWDFNTGNGDMGNQGIHQMDIARWFLGESTISPRVVSVGGRLAYDDAGDTPNSQTVIHDYAAAPLIFETRGLPRAKEFQSNGWGGNMDDYRGSRIGVIVQCEKGHVVIPNYHSATAFDNDNKKIESWNKGGDHYQNFLQAVESRNAGELTADIEEGHLSSALCHTGGVSHQLGKKMTWEEIKSKVADHEVFADSVERLGKHLAANGVDVDGEVVTFGADLRFDTSTESVTNNKDGDERMTRPYRDGFEVASIG